MGIFGDIFGGQAGKDAAAQNTQRLNQLQTTGNGYINDGQTGALGSLQSASSLYAPLAQKYGAGTNLYLDSLGVNGAQGNQAATQAFQASPGYQWNVDQALQGVSRQNNVNGGLFSGNTLAALSDRAGNMANQEYGSWQDRLGGLINPEMAATGGQAQYTAAQAPVYTNAATQRVGLAQGVTNGINDQNTQAANAELAGAGNVFKAGMGLASLAAGAAGGGGFTSLLGGLGGGAASTMKYGGQSWPMFT